MKEKSIPNERRIVLREKRIEDFVLKIEIPLSKHFSGVPWKDFLDNSG